jgi:hypothetical protein
VIRADLIRGIAGRVAKAGGGIAAAAVLGLVAALSPVSPAAAHGDESPDGTNYRTAVTAVSPAVPGLTVRTVEAGSRLELTNHTGRTVEVLGYDGGPLLRVRPDGVYEQAGSPATWRRTATAPVARWQDHRAHWMGDAPPPVVTADPSREHRVRDWVVPVRADASTVEVRGTLDWLPPPAAGTWWALCLIGAAAVASLAVLPRRSAAGTVALAVTALVGGAAGVAYALARAVDAGPAGVAGTLSQVLSGQLWLVLTALAVIAAAAYSLGKGPATHSRGSAADLALALAGACLFLAAGVPNATVFSRAVAPVGWDAVWARVAVAAVIAAGAGLAAAGVLRIRAATPAAQDGSVRV